MAENIGLPADAQVYYLGCGNSVAAIALAQQLTSGQLWIHEDNFIALQMAAETIRLNQLSNAHTLSPINLSAEQRNAFDVAVIELPKGRKSAQRWLAQAFDGLKLGGFLYLAGANQQGIQPTVKDASLLFDQPAVLAYKKGNRLVKFQKNRREWPAEGWSLMPGIAPESWHSTTISSRQGDLELFSLPGVFSFDRLDEGTQLLLTTLPDLHGKNVLDLGCGYGAIGITAAYSGAASVEMADANLLAVAATRKNIERFALQNASASASDVLSELTGKQYDIILSNPPFHTGGEVDYQVAGAFIEQSHQALVEGGLLYLVANRFIRYEKIMQTCFQRVDEIFQSTRYHVLCGVK